MGQSSDIDMMVSCIRRRRQFIQYSPKGRTESTTLASIHNEIGWKVQSLQDDRCLGKENARKSRVYRILHDFQSVFSK